MTKHSKKIAVVTGGTGFLGQSVIARLSDEGYLVIAPFRKRIGSLSSVKKLRKKYPHVDFQIADIESEESVIVLFSYIFNRYGHIDILCNLVGGISEKKWIEEISFDEWNSMMDVNLHTCFLMMKAAIGPMKKNGFGRIITIGSMTALHPESKKSSYAVSKAAVIALTKSVAVELKSFGDITANTIAPSIIATNDNIKWGSMKERKKCITPDEIADMIVYLSSERARGINGQVIEMYGKV